MSERGSSPPSCSKHGNAVARVQRNVAEKQRRDKLNGYISELANIVPMVSMSSKRLDKTSILRLSAAHLRICKSSLGGKQKKGIKWCPNFLTNEQMREILESVDGFLIITTGNGKVLFTSRSVERYLGHQDIDLIGHSVFTFVHPDDLDAVKDEMERILLECVEKGTSCRCTFRCRMREKGQPRSEVVTYQSVHFVGGMTPSDNSEDNDAGSKSVIGHMFKAFVKIVDVSPYNQLSLEETNTDEYVTRHSLDGTIIFADHRLATITGHMPHEVVGLSAYTYIHSEDIPVALFAHHLMFSSDKGTGMIVYRLRTRDDRHVYLKTVGCLQFDAGTSKVDHFVCVNQQLNDSDGDLQLKYFIERYIPHIKGSSATSLLESVKALQTSGSKPDAVKSNGHVLDVTDKTQTGEWKNSLSRHRSVENGKKRNIVVKEEVSSDTNCSDKLSSSFETASSVQVSGINSLDTKYFSKTFHTSSMNNVDVIYVSSLDSMLSINKTTDKVAVMPKESMLPNRTVIEEPEVVGSDDHSHISHFQHSSKLADSSQMFNVRHSPITSMNKSDFAVRSKQLENHSLFNDCSSILDDHSLKLSLMDSTDSVSVLTESAWPAEDFQLKEEISNSSIECYDLPMETNGDVKASQEDLDTFLGLKNGGDSLLPPSNGWNEVYGTTQFASSLTNEGLLQNDEQFSDNPTAKQFDLW